VNRNGATTTQSIGIEVHGGRAVVLIPAGSRTPVARAMTFTTVADGQRAVEVRVVRCSPMSGRIGSASDRGAAADRPAGVIGRFLVPGLRAQPGGAARVDIGISLDRSGILRAWGVDRHTGARQEAAFPGLWALAADSRPRALSRMAARVAAEVSRSGGEVDEGLREEIRLLRPFAEDGAGGPFLAALLGEIESRRATGVVENGFRAAPPLVL
jgi:hypothetical protein